MLKDMTIYVNRCKENNYEQFGDLCENDKVKENCCYIGYEIKIKGKFNTKTGEFFAYSLNGVRLIHPVGI